MLGQLGWGELLLLIVVGLFIFGPERLPGIAKDAGKVIRQLRNTAREVRDDLQSELGPELADLDLQSLSPRGLIEKHLLAEDDEPDDAAAGSPVTFSKADSGAAAAPSRSDATPYDADAT